MKSLLKLSILTLVSASLAQAAVTDIMHLQLGEAGSLGMNNKPQDSVGPFHMQADINGPSVLTITSGLGAPGSTAALHFNGSDQGFYGNGGNMDTATGYDNFGIETWVRTSDITQEGYDVIFSLTGDMGSTGPTIHLANGRWSASIPGVQWIGGDPNSGGGFAAVADEWTSIAVVRDTGVLSLYVNGVAHVSTTTAAPSLMNGFHMAVNPGGATYFLGDIDETRAFTFSPGNFNPTTDLNVPEPSSVLLLGAAAAGMAARRRRSA